MIESNNNNNNEHFKKLINRFIYNDEDLSIQELRELKALFTNSEGNKYIERWLVNNWNMPVEDNTLYSFERLREKIHKHEDKNSKTNFIKQISKYYQRIAAIILLPLLIASAIFFLMPKKQETDYFIAEAPLGQKAKVELVDGTLVWLNSGSKIKYSTNYNKETRDIFLNGEAFFDVRKNKNKPFYVHTKHIDIEVTGTKFNVNAYQNEPSIQTSLIEGHVNLFVNNSNEKYQLTPGKLIEYRKNTGKIIERSFKENETKSWTENELVFINDDFSKLKRKIERWYNMEVIYDSIAFANNKLTVTLNKGEQLSKLLEIIEVASDAECLIKEDKIIITKNNYMKGK